MLVAIKTGLSLIVYKTLFTDTESLAHNDMFLITTLICRAWWSPLCKLDSGCQGILEFLRWHDKVWSHACQRSSWINLWLKGY